MTTLRDALSEALNKAEDGVLPTIAETPIETDPVAETAEQKADRIRDEQGRFTKVEQAEVKAEVVAQPEAVKEVRKPPTSWKKDYWGQWERLGTDPELSTLQDYLEQREREYATGVSTYKSQWDQAAPLMQAIQPFVPELEKHGIQPTTWIQNLGNAHRTLALGTPEQKMQMFVKLATDYGVPLQALTGQQVDPQAGHVMQAVSAMQREVEAIKQASVQREQARLNAEIEAFKTNKPHFEAVSKTMAGLLQSGLAPDLQTAYDKAIRMHDDIWQEQQAEQAKAAEAERQAAIARKKAAAVSPRSSSPTGTVAQGNGKKTLRDQLAESIDEHMGGGRF